MKVVNAVGWVAYFVTSLSLPLNVNSVFSLITNIPNRLEKTLGLIHGGVSFTACSFARAQLFTHNPTHRGAEITPGFVPAYPKHSPNNNLHPLSIHLNFLRSEELVWTTHNAMMSFYFFSLYYLNS